MLKKQYAQWNTAMIRFLTRCSSLAEAQEQQQHARRSVAKAINILGLRVVHFGVGLDHDGAPYPLGVTNPCKNWDQNLRRFGVQDMYDMMLFKSSTVEECYESFERFDLRLYDDLDAVIDTPIHHITYRLLKLYPNAKVVFTHRNPSEWVIKRTAHQMAMPAIQQPCGVLIESLSNEENVEAYYANLELLRCILPQDRFLLIDVWAQDPRDIFVSLSKFLERPNPPENCKFPSKVDHCLNRPGEINMKRTNG
eukprot:CAMPEP_0171470118 /NCGR_PEP_ID=MMETSP0945-20130129/11732_1 /TAXON_ID=109269 /ORGANISM="Vaucheria litorea, Strain CCMP2940" /LENGTH=251 /DNA_ID=CAMNT_0011999477 /DNA_START=184 /DNA_END=936 /DNA_ORIENTATION=+